MFKTKGVCVNLRPKAGDLRNLYTLHLTSVNTVCAESAFGTSLGYLSGRRGARFTYRVPLRRSQQAQHGA